MHHFLRGSSHSGGQVSVIRKENLENVEVIRMLDTKDFEK